MDDSCSLDRPRAAQQQDQSERVLEDQVQQPQRHGEDYVGELVSINRCW
jgi:hypothetical protein